MFKVGDKVQCINQGNTYSLLNGTNYTVTAVIGNLISLSGCGTLTYKADGFELVKDTKKLSDFKKGDKVRVVKGGYHSPAVKIGDIHTIREIDRMQIISDINCWLESELDEIELVHEQTFDWDKFKNDKIAVQCETQEEYNKFIDICTSRRLLYYGGNDNVSDYWKDEDTCVSCNGTLGYSQIHYYKGSLYQVIKFKDAFKEDIVSDYCKADVNLTKAIQSVDSCHTTLDKPKEIEYI